ncbi:MAG: LysR family transcriptional regulator [Rubrivivax sp.]
MNLQLDDVALFVRIVELGSLSAAARERTAPVSQVTRALARLEATCGARLLHRTTHALSLTDEGDAFLAHARRLLETRDDLHGELGGRRAGPRGWVRLGVSPVIAQALIAPSLPALYQRHPQLHVDLRADDRVVDMAREGIDVAIRTGSPAGELLVARPVGQLTRSLYAAPDYLRRHGRPRRMADLARHRLLANAATPALNRWAWGDAARPSEWVVDGHTRTDNTAVLLALALAGVGIGRIVDLVAAPAVARGELERVLDGELVSEAVPMYAVTLPERQRLPKIRACIDHWVEWMQAVPAPPARTRARR